MTKAPQKKISEGLDFLSSTCYNKFIKGQETDWYDEKGSNGFNLFGSVAALPRLLFIYKYSGKMVLTK